MKINYVILSSCGSKRFIVQAAINRVVFTDMDEKKNFEEEDTKKTGPQSYMKEWRDTHEFVSPGNVKFNFFHIAKC